MSTDVGIDQQCQYRDACPRCRCILDADHPGEHDVHCGQPDADVDPTYTRVKALVNAAGYPMPEAGYGYDAVVRMLLSEIGAAKRLADDTYRDGYRTGYAHGKAKGRMEAAR